MGYLGNDLKVAYSTYKNIDDISGSFNGSTTSFSLLVGGVAPSPLPLNSQQCLISVGGVVQRPDDTGAEGFRLSGGNIVFSSAPGTSEDFFGVILAGADYVNVGANFPSGSAAVPSITFDSDLDTGIYNSAANQVSITTAGTERLRIDSAGQIESVSLGSASAPAFSFTTDPNTGIYSPGADQVAISTNGTARVTVNSSGNVGIGSNAPTALLEVSSATDARIQSTNTAGTTKTVVLSGNGTSYIGTTTNHPQAFITNDAERARIDTSGRLLVGTSSAESYYSAYTPSNLFTPGVQVKGAYPNANLALNSTNDGAVIHLANSSTSTSSGRLLGAISFNASDGTNLVAGAGILAYTDATTGTNDMPGRLVFSTTADGASSPTERVRVDSAGDVQVGRTSNFGNSERFVIEKSGAALLGVNRTTSDGRLVAFAQDGTIEGDITVSGTTIAYNGAHLSRWSQLPSGQERTEILRGSVLSNIDEMCEWGEEDNEQLNRMKVSDVEGDKNVSGVFQGWDDDDTYTNDFYCAMTGDFIIRIAEGVTVERGDLLMSAGDGTAKPQDDDIIRSKTIAKVTSTNVSCTYDDGSYCVPCVLMAC